MVDGLSLIHHISVTDSLQISSIIIPIDAVTPPPAVRCRSSCRTAARRTVVKRRRRLKKRRSPPSDGGDDDGGFHGGGGDDGCFSGGGFGGGRGWNFNGSGGGGGGFFNWDDWSSSSSYPDDPAFDFVYEVLCWIVFSNCLHFAFKKVVHQMVAEEREKVPVRIASVC